ncbi:hypothetical protein Sphch_1611 [Sphingobium chlorophenolicum L-1]|uniref:Lipoprotein n=1 Tax=Sphingobium chlorophenolicum L-1 TaxID=690566 RepID=F6EZG9_SPHCR|nr:hypothetical protein [Sphingobium chlorophenolicum]AEG49299.1 hypothetical protein Sphch_1611 [Sphingobium chlorophenolicum L-1]
MPSRTVLRRFYALASITALALVAGCSTPEKAPPTPPPPVVPTIKPLPPMGAVEDMSIPEVATDGSYLTPNRGVTANTALWHVRMALNVAALSCHGVYEPARIQYNRILHVHQAALREANAAVDRNYLAAYGTGGLKARELLNTVVYNFFALPPVTKSFCPVAIDVGAKMLAMPSDQLLAYAPEALTALEKPFQDFYAAYADYLRRLAEWQSRFGGTVTVVASPTPLPPPPVAPREVAPGFAPVRVPGAPVQVEVPTFPLTPMRETFVPVQ